MTPILLIIEGDNAVCHLLETVLTAAGYTVLTNPPHENIRQNTAMRPALAFLDLCTPPPQQVQQWINWLQEKPTIPWIALIDGRLSEEMDWHSLAQSMGAIHLLHKPFRTNVLRDLCRQHIPTSEHPQDSGSGAIASTEEDRR